MNVNKPRPAPDRCQECAVDHEPHEPHNKNSLYYQLRFHMLNSRWPTWADAMAHCTQEVQEAWKKALIDLGEEV